MSKRLIGYATLSSVGIVGFVRGFRYSKYEQYSNKERLYCERVLYGCINTAMYLNPILFPIVAWNEIARAEIRLRGLNEREYLHIFERYLGLRVDDNQNCKKNLISQNDIQ